VRRELSDNFCHYGVRSAARPGHQASLQQPARHVCCPRDCQTTSWVGCFGGHCTVKIVSRWLSAKACQSTLLLGAETNYDNLRACSAWAIESLDKHRNDKREFIYTLCAPCAAPSP